VILRRLEDALAGEVPDDEDPPEDETPRQAVARMGIDVDALAARIHARLDAIDAERAPEPRSSTDDEVPAAFESVRSPPTRLHRSPRVAGAAANHVFAIAGAGVTRMWKREPPRR